MAPLRCCSARRRRLPRRWWPRSVLWPSASCSPPWSSRRPRAISRASPTPPMPPMPPMPLRSDGPLCCARRSAHRAHRIVARCSCRASWCATLASAARAATRRAPARLAPARATARVYRAVPARAPHRGEAPGARCSACSTATARPPRKWRGRACATRAGTAPRAVGRLARLGAARTATPTASATVPRGHASATTAGEAQRATSQRARICTAVEGEAGVGCRCPARASAMRRGTVPAASSSGLPQARAPRAHLWRATASAPDVVSPRGGQHCGARWAKARRLRRPRRSRREQRQRPSMRRAQSPRDPGGLQRLASRGRFPAAGSIVRSGSERRLSSGSLRMASARHVASCSGPTTLLASAIRRAIGRCRRRRRAHSGSHLHASATPAAPETRASCATAPPTAAATAGASLAWGRRSLGASATLGGCSQTAASASGRLRHLGRHRPGLVHRPRRRPRHRRHRRPSHRSSRSSDGGPQRHPLPSCPRPRHRGLRCLTIRRLPHRWRVVRRPPRRHHRCRHHGTRRRWARRRRPWPPTPAPPPPPPQAPPQVTAPEGVREPAAPTPALRRARTTRALACRRPRHPWVRATSQRRA